MQVSGIKHYPPADFEPAASDLARFLWPGESWTQGRERLLLGNGEGGSNPIESRVRKSSRQWNSWQGAFKLGGNVETLPCTKIMMSTRRNATYTHFYNTLISGGGEPA